MARHRARQRHDDPTFGLDELARISFFPHGVRFLVQGDELPREEIARLLRKLADELEGGASLVARGDVTEEMDRRLREGD